MDPAKNVLFLRSNGKKCFIAQIPDIRKEHKEGMDKSKY